MNFEKSQKARKSREITRMEKSDQEGQSCAVEALFVFGIYSRVFAQFAGAFLISR